MKNNILLPLKNKYSMYKYKKYASKVFDKNYIYVTYLILSSKNNTDLISDVFNNILRNNFNYLSSADTHGIVCQIKDDPKNIRKEFTIPYSIKLTVKSFLQLRNDFLEIRQKLNNVISSKIDNYDFYIIYDFPKSDYKTDIEKIIFEQYRWAIIRALNKKENELYDAGECNVRAENTRNSDNKKIDTNVIFSGYYEIVNKTYYSLKEVNKNDLKRILIASRLTGLTLLRSTDDLLAK